jgi:hypothetical protein
MEKKAVEELLNSAEAHKLVELKSYSDLKSIYALQFTANQKWYNRIISYWDLILVGFVNIVCATYLVFFLRYHFSTDPAYVMSFSRVQNEAYLSMTKFWFSVNNFDDYTKEECTIPLPHLMNALTRPVDDCAMCMGLQKIDRLNHISQDDFILKYAYSGIPVIIEDATKNWTAIDVFNFKFFKDLYTNKKQTANRKPDDDKIIDDEDNACQFFPYKTKFKNLEEVFEMTDDYFTQGSKNFKPWYIGW